MPRLNIPKVGDILELTRDWEFDLYDEYRNKALIDKKTQNSVVRANMIKLRRQAMPQRMSSRSDDEVFSGLISSNLPICKVNLPKETKLRIDRIYIRKGDSSDFNSLSFIIIDGKARFWAKLEDCNNIYCK